MSSSADQWMQFYNQISMEEDHHMSSSIEFSDATAVMASAAGEAAATAASESILSPSCSSYSPKGYVSKPVKRRSRASKKTPTTILNANTNNFRALVQQFTGCPGKNFSFGSKKGPVNLNFGLANDQSYETNSAAANFGNSYCDYNQQSHHQVPLQQQPQQVRQDQQQRLVSFDDVGNDAIFATASNYCNPNGFAIDNDMFHELSSDALFSGSRNDSCLL